MSRSTDSNEETIHYSFRVSPTTMYGEGEGVCREMGKIAFYKGFITCKECLEIIDASDWIGKLLEPKTLERSN